MKIVFFGTPDFAVCSLKALIEAGHDIAAVVTTPDRKGGRGNQLIESGVKKYAVANNLPILQPEKLRDEEFLASLKSIGADLFVVIAFRMLPEVVWSMPRLGTFNLHASLLPQLRGAAPINHAIMAGFKTTGVTTFFINKEIDKGEILLSSQTSISDDDDAGTLHDRLMEMGADLVLRTVKGLADGSLHSSPQPQSDFFTPAPKIFKEDCRIDFNNPSRIIERKVRGLSPYPGAWAILRLADGKEIEVKILKVKLDFNQTDFPPGTCFVKSKSFLVATADSAVEILTIQPSGKKPMEAKAFLAGYSPREFV